MKCTKGGRKINLAISNSRRLLSGSSFFVNCNYCIISPSRYFCRRQLAVFPWEEKCHFGAESVKAKSWSRAQKEVALIEMQDMENPPQLTELLTCSLISRKAEKSCNDVSPLLLVFWYMIGYFCLPVAFLGTSAWTCTLWLNICPGYLWFRWRWMPKLTFGKLDWIGCEVDVLNSESLEFWWVGLVAAH